MITLYLLLAATDPFEQLADPAFVPPPADALPTKQEAPPPPKSDTPPPPKDEPQAEKKRANKPIAPGFPNFNQGRLPHDQGGISAHVGYNIVDFAQYLRLEPNLRFEGKNYGIELGAPILLSISSPDANQKQWNPRKYDWDEWRDYLKILRGITIGSVDEGFEMKIGAVDGFTLRNGGLVRRYSNNLLADQTRQALSFISQSDLYETKLVWSDVTFGSAILGLSMGVTPAAKSDSRILQSLELGASYAVEAFTPTDCKLDGNTGGCTTSAQREPQMNGRGLHGFTVDLGIAPVNFDFLRVKVFAEFGMLIAFGNQIAAGIDIDAPLGPVRLGARGEYRNFGDKWMPAYFGSFHEVERFSFLSSRSTAPVTQFAFLDSLTPGARQHSASAELRFNAGRYFRALGAVDIGGYDVAQQFVLHLESQPLDWLTLFGTYQKRNFAQWNELFKFTDTDMLRAGLYVAPVSWLIITGYAGRTFVWTDALAAYQGTWNIGASLGFRYAFGF